MYNLQRDMVRLEIKYGLQTNLILSWCIMLILVVRQKYFIDAECIMLILGVREKYIIDAEWIMLIPGVREMYIIDE